MVKKRIIYLIITSIIFISGVVVIFVAPSIAKANNTHQRDIRDNSFTDTLKTFWDGFTGRNSTSNIKTVYEIDSEGMKEDIITYRIIGALISFVSGLSIVGGVLYKNPKRINTE